MKRFFGMMPSDEVEIEKHYKTNLGTVTIQAGKEGYSILFADGSSKYEDIQDTTENNFNKAYELFKDLTKIDSTGRIYMNVYCIERIDKVSWCQDYKMIVVAENELCAEKAARLKSADFRKAPLEVTEIDLTKEAVISVENTGA